ncbi:Endoglucanase 3 [Hordeum vulgare]|nr:Endoglucanase 3 [Hordeum vulgare]
MEEMASLEGEECAFQEKRVKDLLDAANQQHAWFDPGQAQSESPGPTWSAPSTLAVSIMQRIFLASPFAAEGAREAKTGALSARASTLQACVAEATRAIQSVRLFPREELSPFATTSTRWTELCNSCQGVHEVQAIQYFIDGCRDGTLLKHKLMCSEPTSLAVLMAKADKYATADSAMRVKVTASDKVVPTPATPKPAGDNRGGQNNYKRKADQADSRSNSKLVASVEGETIGSSSRPSAKASQQKQHQLVAQAVLRAVARRPCKIHSGAQPSSHTLRQCSFARRLSQGDGLPTPPGV